MTHLLKRSEFPTLSADPQKQVVDLGFPLYRFKDRSRHLKLFQQDQVLSRTNDYKPTPATLKRQLKPAVRHILLDIPELKQFNKREIYDILLQDVEQNRQFEEMDPLKGNSLIVTDYLDQFELYLFSAGTSLSNLVIMKSKKREHGQLQLSLDEMTIKDTINLLYPIRQIQLSLLSTLYKKIFIVRTTCSLHLFKLEREELRLIHEFRLPQQSATNTLIDYSMPIHVETSPFYEYQYVFITNNGYHALVDASKNKTLFENVDPIPAETNYKSRWKSCGFGKTPSTIYITSPESIKEFVVRDSEIASNILAAPNDRIIAFKSSQLLYCFATLEAIVVMDRMISDRPVVTWKHKMRDGPPTEIIIENLVNDNWRIVAFSHHTQRYTMMHFHYVNNPQIDIKPVMKILEIFNFTLPILKCEEIYNYTSRINSVGCSLRSIGREIRDTTKGNAFFSISRLFEDGSIKIQYLALETEQSSITTLQPRPQYQLKSTTKTFDEIVSTAQSSILPAREGKHVGLAEVWDLDMKNFKEYLNEEVMTESNKLPNSLKIKIAEKVRGLKSTTTYRQLFDDDEDEEQEYENYSLEELVDFLEQMQVHESIERARQIDIPGVFTTSTQQPTDSNLHSKLKQAHEKEIQLASLMIRPLKDNNEAFQYLNNDNHFTSTTTTRVLADLWQIDDTRFEQLNFPQLKTNRLSKKEKFPCLSIYKRKRSLEEDELPLLLPPPPPSAPARQKRPVEKEIPMPVVVASSQPLPKAKKLKSAVSVSKSVPVASIVVLSDDEEEEKITPQKLAQSVTYSSSQPTEESSLSLPSNTFANTSTQPLPGVFGARTKKVVPTKKKSKKPKTSGFR